MPTGPLHQLVRFAPPTQDHVPAVRIALTVGLPQLLLLALGRLDLSIYAAFGAFTAIYGRQEAPRLRLRHQCQAALMLLVCIALGLGLSRAHADPWLVVAVCGLVAGGGAVLTAVLRLRPAGSTFLIFAAGAIGSIPHPASWSQGLGTAGATAAWSVLAGLAGALLGEGRRGHVAPPPGPHGMDRRRAVRYGLMFFLAPLIAGLLGQASGLSHSYWAMVAAAAAIAGPNSRARLHRGMQRVIGTLGGVLITAFVLSQHPQPWHLVVWVIIFQFLTETYVLRNYAFATLFITPLALLMLQLGHPSSVGTVLTARLAETAIGGAVAIALVLLTRTREERRAGAHTRTPAGAERSRGGAHRPETAPDAAPGVPTRTPEEPRWPRD
ncbi:FUSC family protein [Rothia kristinae]|uniref:FUSC family protein n=1 Tax=Rothia kristinae TaxID=37923 RepID=A0A7T3CET0_9MICC|nr:FUSC family protein [Rothia kristinae]QPT52864.1 FUSC family protein [Rothia kristinae]